MIKENYSSQNLWQKVNLLTEEQIYTLTKGLKWTVKNIPDAVLIGGTATVNYVVNERELTPDLDFMITDIWSVKTKLNQDDIQFKSLNIGTGKSFGIVVDKHNTDYLDSNVGNLTLNKLILKTSNTTTIGGYHLKIVPVELLVILKIELGRDKDLNDALSLLSIGDCDRNEYISYANQLKDSLQEYNAIIEYQKIIK